MKQKIYREMKNYRKNYKKANRPEKKYLLMT